MIERTKTGIAGLDKMLEGGIPKERTLLIVGGPGTGKSILCTQFLVYGIRMYDESGIFVSLEESKKHIYQAVSRFNWDLDKLEKSGKFSFVDASPIRRAPGEVKIGKYVVGKRDFSMLGLINTVEQLVESTHAKRVVVDPLSTMIFQYPDVYARRNAYMDLIESLTATGATCMTTMEAPSTDDKNVIEEEYLAHGVLLMQSLQVGRALVRVMQVRKMRATAAEVQPRPYKIDEAGITVFADESVL